MKWKRNATLAVALGAMLGAATPSGALDLTGTWSFRGKSIKCVGLDLEGEKFVFQSPAEDLPPVRIGGSAVDTITPAEVFGRSAAIEAFGTDQKGIALIPVCQDETEMYLRKVKVFPENSAGVSGTAVGDYRGWIDDALLVCTIRLERTDTKDPGLPAAECDPAAAANK